MTLQLDLSQQQTLFNTNWLVGKRKVKKKIVVSCNIAPIILTHIRPNSNWNLPAAVYLAMCCGLRNTAVAFTLEQFI